jgi:hypothetical protein
MKKIALCIALALSGNVNADVISGDMTLRDAIYLYGQTLRANGAKTLVGENCDVFQLVLDMESGYTDIRYAQGGSLSATESGQTLYGDRLFDWHAMFAYALYQDQPVKTFSFVDQYYTGSGFSVGSGTVFGYCYSTKPGGRVYLIENDLCTKKYSDSHTENIPGCTPATFTPNTNPTMLTEEVVNGKTFYDVYWDNDKPVVSKIQFSNGTATQTGILNNTFTESSAYTIDGNGVLAFVADPSQTTKIVCGGGKQYFKTHNYLNGQYDGADLVFFDQAAALNYASKMSGSVPPCKVPKP